MPLRLETPQSAVQTLAAAPQLTAAPKLTAAPQLTAAHQLTAAPQLTLLAAATAAAAAAAAAVAAAVTKTTTMTTARPYLKREGAVQVLSRRRFERVVYQCNGPEAFAAVWDCARSGAARGAWGCVYAAVFGSRRVPQQAAAASKVLNS